MNAFGRIFQNAAIQHRSLFNALVESSDRTLTIKVSQERSETGGSSMFGDFTTTPTETVEHGPFSCLWYDTPTLSTAGNRTSFSLTGFYPEMKAVALLKLKDILTNPSDPYSETYIDKARYVVSAGRTYRVLGLERDGMATAMPYIALVVLSGEVANVPT